MKTNPKDKRRPNAAPMAKAPVYEKTGRRGPQPVAQPGNIEPMKVEPLERANFMGMIISAVIIIVGFLLMLGPGSTPEAFNPDIFSTRRIVVGPTIAFIGFLLMGWAIIYSPVKKNKQTETNPEGGHD